MCSKSTQKLILCWDTFRLQIKRTLALRERQFAGISKKIEWSVKTDNRKEVQYSLDMASIMWPVLDSHNLPEVNGLPNGVGADPTRDKAMT